MELLNKLFALYPELTSDDFSPFGGTIALQNDSDGRGDYIQAWNHPTLSEPTPEQLLALEVTP